MKDLLKFIPLLLFAFAHNAIAECDKTKCLEAPKHYYELGCKPIYDAEGCCAIRFECPERPVDDKCRYKDKTYKRNTQLPDEIHTKCAVGCRCDRPTIGLEQSHDREWNCGRPDCPNAHPPPEADCEYIPSPFQCCGYYACGEELKKAYDTKCYLNHREYHKGEFMFLPDCHVCICSEGFDNSTTVGNKYCHKIECGFELNHLHKLKRGCIPYYTPDPVCCPEEDFRCPNNKTDVVIAKHRPEYLNDPKMVCKFGKLTLKWGDELKSTKSCVTCTCSIPPDVMCLQNGVC